MASATSGDPHLPSLSTPNLRKLDAGKSDKTSFLRSYIRSQEAHLASYAREGKSLAAAWASPSVQPAVSSRPTKRVRDVELESGFGTPLLKPRQARIAPRPDARSPRVHKEAADSVRIGTEGKGNRPTASSSKPVKDAVGVTVDIDRASDTDERPTKRLRQSGLQQFAKPLLRTTKKIAHAKDEQSDTRTKPLVKKRTAHVDEDHENSAYPTPLKRISTFRKMSLGLAARRERRRAKKAIVDPKPIPAASVSSVGSEDGDRDYAVKGLEQKKGKKGKALKIPAGLALMHGFSAQNIGKNRLTVSPLRCISNVEPTRAVVTIRHYGRFQQGESVREDSSQS